MVKKKKRNRKYLYILAGIAAAILVMVLLEMTNTTHFFHDRKPKPVGLTGNAYTKGSGNTTKQIQSGSSDTGSSTSPASSSAKQPDSTASNSSLTVPWGTFANENTATSSEAMESTCNTTPGATCQVIFTDGSLTKSLSVQSTDAGGAVYWSWTPNQIGLTPGTWHMTMKAVLGSQTQTASDDPLTLEVSQ